MASLIGARSEPKSATKKKSPPRSEVTSLCIGSNLNPAKNLREKPWVTAAICTLNDALSASKS
jgi:hypothetical protein